MRHVKLKEELKRLKSGTSGNKKELQNHLRSAVTVDIGHGQDTESEEEKRDVERAARVVHPSISFREMEESLNGFREDNNDKNLNIVHTHQKVPLTY